MGVGESIVFFNETTDAKMEATRAVICMVRVMIDGSMLLVSRWFLLVCLEWR